MSLTTSPKIAYTYKIMLSKWICERPALGITASITGFGASILALLQDLSIVLGFLGAVLGFAAGFYTWRIKREHWNRVKAHTTTTVVTTTTTDSQKQFR
jgi:hypothetical protein